jgi:hypothetical protein
MSFPFSYWPQTVGRLREPEVGVHAGDHDPGIDGEEFEADQETPDIPGHRRRSPDLVQDDFDHVGQPTGSRTLQITPPPPRRRRDDVTVISACVCFAVQGCGNLSGATSCFVPIVHRPSPAPG